jgi:ribose-phosphate pyrophosphokinase
MLRRNERVLDNIPVGDLGIIAIDGCTEMGKRVNDYIAKWRNEDGHAFEDDILFQGYKKDNYLVNAKVGKRGY